LSGRHACKALRLTKSVLNHEPVKKGNAEVIDAIDLALPRTSGMVSTSCAIASGPGNSLGENIPDVPLDSKIFQLFLIWK
jgi:hypothetical protein